jgi:ferredoxin-like protein FixX
MVLFFQQWLQRKNHRWWGAAKWSRVTKRATTNCKRYGLTYVCPSTVYKWMKGLGFQYETRKKGYYVDGHENPSTV